MCQINEIPGTFLSVAHPFVFEKDSLYMYEDLGSLSVCLYEYLDSWILPGSRHCSRCTYTLSCVSCLGMETTILWISR